MASAVRVEKHKKQQDAFLPWTGRRRPPRRGRREEAVSQSAVHPNPSPPCQPCLPAPNCVWGVIQNGGLSSLAASSEVSRNFRDPSQPCQPCLPALKTDPDDAKTLSEIGIADDLDEGWIIKGANQIMGGRRCGRTAKQGPGQVNDQALSNYTVRSQWADLFDSDD